MRDREAAERTFLHLSMRPLTAQQVVPASPGPWAVFGWVMISAAVIFAVLVIVFMVLFVTEPVPGA